MCIKRSGNKRGFLLSKNIVICLLGSLFFLLPFTDSIGQTDQEVIEWKLALSQNLDWYSSKEAIRIGDNVLFYQYPNGGWSKNLDMAKELNEDEVNSIKTSKHGSSSQSIRTTIDNGATYTQMRYLAKVFEGTELERFKEAFVKGVDYLLEAQYDNGGWPQYFPLREGYYKHITFNDGAMIGVMEILRDISKGNYSFVDRDRVIQSQKAISKGLKIILKSQIVVNDKLTAWCAQHDALNLEPVRARTYELPSISGAESVGILKYLMKIEEPSAAIINAIKSAIEWLDSVKITGVRLIRNEDATLPKGYDLVIGFDPLHATSLWARFYEIDTFYPMFLDRDGIVKYALSEIGYERRNGYRWLGGWANSLLNEDYPIWLETLDSTVK